MAKRHGRHTPAFLLLQLTYAPAYGGMLLKKLEEELPHLFSDSAMIYRSLIELEKNKFIKANWKTNETGKPIKWYEITPEGLELLDELAKDIKMRNANFEYFLSKYNLYKDLN